MTIKISPSLINDLDAHHSHEHFHKKGAWCWDFYKLGYNAPNDFVSNYKFLRSDYGWKNE